MSEPYSIETFIALGVKELALYEKIAEAARPLLPLLEDLKMLNSTKVLKELFFELEALKQERGKLLLADPVTSLKILTELRRRTGGDKP